MARKMMMNAKLRRKAGNAVQQVLKPTYFKEGVPMEQLDEVLKSHGIMMVQEDNTEWAGFFCGTSGNCLINIAPISSAVDSSEYKNITFYEPFENACLLLTWYKCENRTDGAYEIIGYIS